MSISSASGVWASPSTHLPPSWQALARSVFAIGLAGIAAGLLIAGVGSRLVMRASSLLSPDVSGTGIRSEQGFRVGEVTREGSIELVLFLGIVGGLFGAVYYAIARPWLMWAGKWHGVAFGVLLFAIGSAASDVFNPDNRDFVILDNIPLIVLMFFGLFVLFGVVIAAFYDRLNRRLPASDSGPVVALYALATILSLIFVGGAMVMVATSEGCDCDAPVISGSAFVVLAAVTLGLGALRLISGGSRVRTALTTIGWAALAVAFVAGLARAISDLSEILTL